MSAAVRPTLAGRSWNGLTLGFRPAVRVRVRVRVSAHLALLLLCSTAGMFSHGHAHATLGAPGQKSSATSNVNDPGKLDLSLQKWYSPHDWSVPLLLLSHSPTARHQGWAQNQSWPAEITGEPLHGLRMAPCALPRLSISSLQSTESLQDNCKEKNRSADLRYSIDGFIIKPRLCRQLILVS